MTEGDTTSTDEPGSHGELSLGQKARALLDSTMRGLVAGAPAETSKAAAAAPPAPIRALLDDLLSKRDTYRDGALTLLAFPVAAGAPLNVTVRIDGDRAASGHVERVLRDLAIPARKDALQTIAKGSNTFLGRSRPSWNELLVWASEEEALADVEAAFYYLAREIASTARNVPPMPSLDAAKLTFARVVALVDSLLSTHSGGAFEQFILGAFLYAAAEEEGRRRVETKSLHASDVSAGTAGDVQVYDGGVATEAYEVTANAWETKIDQALDVMKRYDLRRVHIVAPGPRASAEALGAALPPDADVSVLEIASELRSLIHRLQRPGRRAALVKLYEHLVERQPKDELITQFINAITQAGLADSS